jgi:phage terminase small subunit
MQTSQKPNDKHSELTTKQQLFCEFYIGAANGNATEAARLAGYKGNDVTLTSVGAENLRKPHISALCKKRVQEAAMSADAVLKHISAIALATNEATRDRLTALQLLGKFHKLFTDNLDLKSNGKGLTFAAIVALASEGAPDEE